MTLLGIDASHHQGLIDFAAVKRAGNSFVFLKATEGTGYTDVTFAVNRTAARAAGLVVGAYHFASAGDPTAEADHFCAVVGSLTPGDLVVLDWETTAPNPPAWCRTWLDRVHAKLSVRPLIYMNQTTRDGFDWSPVVAGNYGLWLAQYDGNQSVPNPGKWPNVALKQFTSSGTVPGVAGSCDRNVFFGDAAVLAAYGYQETDMPLSTQDLTNVAAAVVNRQVDGDARLWECIRDLHHAMTNPPAPAPVNVDAAAVAAALASNTAFLASLAKAVNDDAAARLKS